MQGIGDATLASQSLRLALIADPTHAPAYNNLGVLEAKQGKIQVAQSMFQASAGLAPVLFEPHFNYAHLANEVTLTYKLNFQLINNCDFFFFYRLANSMQVMLWFKKH